MSEQEKKQQRIYDLFNAESKPQFLCLAYTEQRKKIIEKVLFKEKWELKIDLKTKRSLFDCSRYDNQEGSHNANKKSCQ